MRVSARIQESTHDNAIDYIENGSINSPRRLHNRSYKWLAQLTVTTIALGAIGMSNLSKHHTYPIQILGYTLAGIILGDSIKRIWPDRKASHVVGIVATLIASSMVNIYYLES